MRKVIEFSLDLSCIGLQLTHVGFDSNRSQYSDGQGNEYRIAYDPVLKNWVVLLKGKNGWRNKAVTENEDAPTMIQTVTGFAFLDYAPAVAYLRNQKIDNLFI